MPLRIALIALLAFLITVTAATASTDTPCGGAGTTPCSSESGGSPPPPPVVLALPGSAFPDVNLSPPNSSVCRGDPTNWINGNDETNGFRGNRFRLYVCDRPVRPLPTGDEEWSDTLSTSEPNESDESALPHTTRTAKRVWDGAIALTRFLDAIQTPAHPHHLNVSGFRVLEVGSGIGGLSGMAAAALGAEPVFITDLPEVMPGLQFNIQLNSLGHRAKAHPFDWLAGGELPIGSTNAKDDMRQTCKAVRQPLLRIWTDPPYPFQLILGADVFWVERLIEPLIFSLSCIMKPETTILIAHQSRAKRTDDLVAHWFGVYGFTVQTLERSIYGSPIDILRVTQRVAPPVVTAIPRSA